MKDFIPHQNKHMPTPASGEWQKEKCLFGDGTPLLCKSPAPNEQLIGSNQRRGATYFRRLIPTIMGLAEFHF